MCGIAGILNISLESDPVDRRELLRIRDVQTLRGPDSSGAWFSEDGRIALGHRRLAIIGLDIESEQPMVSSDKRFVVVFNGEIYNYKEIRKNLETKGKVFRSQSDTEVLLHLYQVHGREMVHELRGMFAFALWDVEQKRLLLARDPYGIKPLYYSDNGRQIRFASQVKAILAGGAVSQDLDPAGLVGFLTWGSVPEPFTCFRKIRSLPAGATLVVDENGADEPELYFEPNEYYCEFGTDKNNNDLVERTRAAFEDSVKVHMVADVPVGAFLSAGVDSTAIVSLASALSSEPLRTVTLAFDEFKGTPRDEALLAEETARSLGCDHQTVRLSLDDVLMGMEAVASVMDQPSIDGVNSYWVSLAAKERGLKVALSGLGGDELFGGYPSFSLIPKLAPPLSLLGKWGLLRPVAGIVRKLSINDHRREKFVTLLNNGGTVAGAYLAMRGLFMPHELGEILNPDLVRSGTAVYTGLEAAERISQKVNPIKATIAVLEQSLYMRNQLLRDTDWASMAHSLEVRVPLVDRVLYRQISTQTLTSFSRKHPKWLLANAVGNRAAHQALSRRKTGFSFPFAKWIQEGKWKPWPKQFENELFSPSLPRIISQWQRDAASGNVSWARVHAVDILDRYLRSCRSIVD